MERRVKESGGEESEGEVERRVKESGAEEGEGERWRGG